MHPLNLPKTGRTIQTSLGKRIISNQQYRLICKVAGCMVGSCQQPVYLITIKDEQTLDQHSPDKIGVVRTDGISNIQDYYIFEAKIEDLYPI